MVTVVKRGDIYYADLSPVVGSEQGGLRPVLIIQNDVGNRYSPTVIAAAITSRLGKTKLPTHIDVHAERAGLSRDSVVLLEQLRTLDKRRLRERLGHLDEALMEEIDTAIAVSLGLIPHGTRLTAASQRKHAVVYPPAPLAPVARQEGADTLPGAAVASTAQSATDAATAVTAAPPLKN